MIRTCRFFRVKSLSELRVVVGWGLLHPARDLGVTLTLHIVSQLMVWTGSNTRWSQLSCLQRDPCESEATSNPGSPITLGMESSCFNLPGGPHDPAHPSASPLVSATYSHVPHGPGTKGPCSFRPLGHCHALPTVWSPFSLWVD